MPRTDIDALRKEQEADEQLEKSFTTNPVKLAIQELFHNEFSGNKYRKYTVQQAKDLIEERVKLATAKPGPYSSAAMNVLTHIKKAKTMEEVLTSLNEYLFS